MSGITARASWKATLLTTAVTAGVLTTLSASPAGAVPGDPAAGGSYAYTARLAIGDNVRACTGALVDRYWVITAASCFADDPAQPQALPAGAPKWKTTATVGDKTVDLAELVTRQDRDLVMARLATPVTGVATLPVATTAPTAGENLRVPGYGRTKDEWIPNKLHSGAFTLDTVAATAIATTGTGGAAICKGDTGAPAIREKNGKAELVAVASRSWQGGCLGETETRTGASSSRVDDLGAWVQQTRSLTPDNRTTTVYEPAAQTSEVFRLGTDRQIYGSSFKTGSAGWSAWQLLAPREFVSGPTAVYHADKNTTEVFAIGTDRQVYHSWHNPGSSTWADWQLLAPGKVTGPLQAVYHADKNTIEVIALGDDQQVYHSWYTTGATSWSTWTLVAPGKFTTVNANYIGDRRTNQIYAIGDDGQIYQSYYTTGTTGWTPWQLLAPGRYTALSSVYHADKETIEVAALGEDRKIYHSWYSDATWTWSNFQLVAPGTFTALSTAYQADKNTIEIVALDDSRQIQHSWYTTGATSWSTWTLVAPGKFATAPSTLYHADKNTIETVAVGDDQQVYHAWYTTGTTGWSPWTKLP
ncbi:MULTISPECIES: trypsin-like serine protease [unclassified Kitasatospora]|uniref:trypsin-like serine protease n=1 Tax=unclassified Kitasatospora TaxID=2633591 RepID=UPI00380EBE37